MLVFGMGLYELFVSNLGTASSLPGQKPSDRSSLFGLFTLKVSFGTLCFFTNLILVGFCVLCFTTIYCLSSAFRPCKKNKKTERI